MVTKSCVGFCTRLFYYYEAIVASHSSAFCSLRKIFEISSDRWSDGHRQTGSPQTGCLCNFRYQS